MEKKRGYPGDGVMLRAKLLVRPDRHWIFFGIPKLTFAIEMETHIC